MNDLQAQLAPTVRPEMTFTLTELSELFDTSRLSLRRWMKKRWLRPAVKGSVGRSLENRFSLWQSAGIAYLTGCLKEARLRSTYVGKTAVIQTMRAMENLDDALLMPVEMHDSYVQEVWAKFINTPFPFAELPPQALENLARLTRAIREKVFETQGRIMGQRIRGE